MMRKLSAIVLLVCVSACGILHAQPKGRPAPNMLQPDQIDPAEGPKILKAFSSARTAGDYIFGFELVNKPRNGKKSVFTGTMYGTWTPDGVALTRTDLDLPGGGTLQMIYSGGVDGTILESRDGGPARKLDGQARFQPIVEGLTFTAFDLQMSFMQWTDYVYEGTEKLLGRPAHYFILYPPEGVNTEGVAAVRVAIDADFLVMLSAEELDADSNSIKKFRINDFAKVDGQWIVKEIDLVDQRTKDRTRFRVEKAQVGGSLSPDLFEIQPDGGMKKTTGFNKSTDSGAGSN